MNNVEEVKNKICEIERNTINGHYSDLDFWIKTAIFEALKLNLVTNAAILDELEVLKHE